MSALSEKSAFEAFARMEEKIDQNERQIRASAEIDEELTGDRLSKDFKQLEKASTALDADYRLLQLKQQMGMLGAGAAGAAKQIGAGSGSAGAPASSSAGGAAPVAGAVGSGGAGAGTAGALGPGSSHPDDDIPTASVEEIPDGHKPG